ncbi:hypothetical protein QNM97_10370 [Gordonia sp. L191]|uniref:hypothetical protein n=1 Tax=Gordonia sp. L191 TaxID=2982699 RepID=UPI0024BF6079|nr:hypothetical protein [Gordonia sp. L191]WHU49338.1 hypothetical protein QNM97_10370 [Gordonia sp. L191]
MASRVTADDVTEWRRLLTGGWTLREVAEHYGVDARTVHRHVGARGIRTGPREYDITVEQALAAYTAAGSQRAAAADLGVSRSVIRRRLQLAGLNGWRTRR